MKQVFQDGRTGTIEVADLPEPALRPGTLLVRNAYSVISPGTERNTMRVGRDSLLALARSRPDLVRRAIDTVRREGVLATYRKMRSRLDDLRDLGYSSAGIVVAVGPGAGDYFRVGDRVACAGAGHASHAELICVPSNLAARVPAGVPLDAAAFSTLGAVAMHGVRQASPALGERVAVIGLGILGLLTVQLLRASGVRVIAFDLDPEAAERARRAGADAASAGPGDEQVAAALAWTDGVGVDGVIVTAASSDDGPMVAAAGMCRDRARVVAVGLVPYGLPRDIAYAKEIQLRIARSYGPGRYDAAFEEKGLDYPIGYVRWTETRNLEAFLDLVAAGRVTPLEFVTHRSPVEEAPRAYALLVSDAAPRPLGMVLEYARLARLAPEVAPAATMDRASQPAVRRTAAPAVRPGQPIEVAFIGAGTFARSVLLPALRRRRDVRLRTVITTHGLTALKAQRQFGFTTIGTDVSQVLADPEIHLVFVVTRHDQHADLATQALLAGKHVFVEKPLAIDEEGLARVEAAAAQAPGLLMVGFNRRFSPHARAIREAFAGRGPLLMTYRVNAGPLPPGHWLNDPAVGGGRIIGEACHFVDLMSYLTGDAEIISVQARGTGRSRDACEDFAALLSFADGSAGQLLYTARGSPRVAKEYLEVHGGGVTAMIDDFRECTIYQHRKSRGVAGKGKGHEDEVQALTHAVVSGGPSLVPVRTLIAVSRSTMRLRECLGSGGVGT